MISKAAILERAAEWQLDPEVVEKDYVLGWLLWGIARHSVLGEHWVFKGGTCLKKCVIETYRFSEDLDFSLLPSAPYTAGEIRPLLLELVADVEASSGIAFPRDAVTVKPRQDRAGRRTFEGRTGYVGPIGNHGPPRIRFDLTIHETVVRSPIRRTVIHPYPDPFPEERGVLSYSTAELIAEKTRALVERTRPRDLYDVILLGTVHRDVSLEEALRGVAREKFATKGLSLPSAEEIIRMARASEELRSEWINMLGHQLPAVPELDDYLERLTDALSWIEEPATGTTHRAPGLASIATSDEVPVIERGVRLWGVGAPLEAIRFAGASRLLVEITYKGQHRVIEPYSLRRPRTGNLFLYGFERTKDGFPAGEIRAYNVAEIAGVRVLSRGFTPRFAIELNEQSGVWRG